MNLKIRNIFKVNTEDHLIEILNNNLKKLVIVCFSATWCGPCKAMKPEIIKISQTLPEAFFAYIDVDKYQDVNRNYKQGVEGVPHYEFYYQGTKRAYVKGANLRAFTETLRQLYSNMLMQHDHERKILEEIQKNQNQNQNTNTQQLPVASQSVQNTQNTANVTGTIPIDGIPRQPVVQQQQPVQQQPVQQQPVVQEQSQGLPQSTELASNGTNTGNTSNPPNPTNTSNTTNPTNTSNTTNPTNPNEQPVQLINSQQHLQEPEIKITPEMAKQILIQKIQMQKLQQMNKMKAIQKIKELKRIHDLHKLQEMKERVEEKKNIRALKRSKKKNKKREAKNKSKNKTA